MENEIFTIGDKITIDNEKGVQQIAGFFIGVDKKMYVSICGENPDNAPLLSQIQHVKKPLFTTEDGVDIYENEEYYWINPGNKFYSYQWEIRHVKKEMGGAKPEHVKQDDKYGFKNFSTKKAAEEYILMNKPYLSINEIMNLPKTTFSNMGNLNYELKNLVTAKMINF